MKQFTLLKEEKKIPFFVLINSKIHNTEFINSGMHFCVPIKSNQNLRLFNGAV